MSVRESVSVCECECACAYGCRSPVLVVASALAVTSITYLLFFIYF